MPISDVTRRELLVAAGLAAVAATAVALPARAAYHSVANPCAAKKMCVNPCNPCGAKIACPCNPCAAKSPCSPCNPCNPCAAKTPCNPCNPCAAN